ncbi:MAG: DNA repair protein RecO [Flavobacteriales bacterium]|nr:DNA repair protein RecO [Flavobacteriales bacterium]
MLHTFKGVVLNYIKYSENSFITKIYTDKFGMQSFIIKGVGGKKSKSQRACLQPLSIVEINAYYKENTNLKNVKNIKLDVVYQTIPFNIYKSSIAFFLAEVLEKLIKEEETNKDLFEFIYHAFKFFDLSDKNYTNFHLIFLLQLTKYFGIYPLNLNDDDAQFFDLESGSFKVLQPKHPLFSSTLNTAIIKSILRNSFKTDELIEISNLERKKILSEVLEYYSIHSYNLKKIKSKEVLSELLT